MRRLPRTPRHELSVRIVIGPNLSRRCGRTARSEAHRVLEDWLFQYGRQSMPDDSKRHFRSHQQNGIRYSRISSRPKTQCRESTWPNVNEAIQAGYAEAFLAATTRCDIDDELRHIAAGVPCCWPLKLKHTLPSRPGSLIGCLGATAPKTGSAPVSSSTSGATITLVNDAVSATRHLLILLLELRMVADHSEANVS
jgi:hypothetical protein